MAATTHLQPTARLRGGVEEEEEVKISFEEIDISLILRCFMSFLE